MTRIKFLLTFVILATSGVQAQTTCYELGLKNGTGMYNEAQRLLGSQRRGEASAQFRKALHSFQSTGFNCGDVPVNHELKTWMDKCIDGIRKSDFDPDRETLSVTPKVLSIGAKESEITINVKTDAGDWSVTAPSWCSYRKINHTTLRINCKANTERDVRTGTIKITNNLSVEIPIVQSYDRPEPENHQRIQITSVQFKCGYENNTFSNLGEPMYNNMISLIPEITYNNLEEDKKTMQLDFKILSPNGSLLPGAVPGYTYSETVTTGGQLQRGDIFNVSGWGNSSGTTFAMAGKYTFEIWCAGVRMNETSFDVAERKTSTPVAIVELSVSPRYLAFTAKGGEQSVTVNTQASDWKLIKTPSWCSITQDNNRLYVTCSENTEANVRRDIIMISADSRQTEIEVHQEAKLMDIKLLKTSFGVKAGLNLSNISNGMTDIKFSPEMKPDFHAGIFLNLRFNGFYFSIRQQISLLANIN